jgi:hypothetical protein
VLAVAKSEKRRMSAFRNAQKSLAYCGSTRRLCHRTANGNCNGRRQYVMRAMRSRHAARLKADGFDRDSLFAGTGD